TDPVNLDQMLWPRAAAAAEVLWSGKKDLGGKERNVANATRRLAEMRERLVTRGVGAAPVQMVWCLQNEGRCVL
ncbi:MAG: N-acetyl-glucosamine-6-phosphate deacetylase, partial [Pleopsidium flavum]